MFFVQSSVTSHICPSCQGVLAYIDEMPFDEKNDNAYWKNCSLRYWLNKDFYENAFSDEEKQSILLSTLENPSVKFAEVYTDTILAAGDEPYFYYYPDENYDSLANSLEEEDSMELQKTKAEPSTQDHVFILSLQEAGLYAMDIDSPLLSYKSKYDYSYSWLRTHASPTVYDTGAMVSGYEDFYPWGFYTDEPMPVRPAIWGACK